MNVDSVYLWVILTVFLSFFLSTGLWLQDHSQFVNCVRFSPDGSRFVTAGADGQVRVGLLGFHQRSLSSKIISPKDSCSCLDDPKLYVCTWIIVFFKSTTVHGLFFLMSIFSTDFSLWWNKWWAGWFTGWREGPQRRDLCCKQPFIILSDFGLKLGFNSALSISC